MIKPENVRVGMAVWYYPYKPGPGFKGEVREDPWRLGDGTWVTHLTKMEEAYGKHVGLPNKRSVHAASLDHLDPRLPETLPTGLPDGASTTAVAEKSR